MQLNTQLIRAIAKKDGAFIVILDTDKVFSEDELQQIQTHTQGGK
jgi:chemotaxis signal transduction protein